MKLYIFHGNLDAANDPIAKTVCLVGEGEIDPPDKWGFSRTPIRRYWQQYLYYWIGSIA